MEGHEMANLRKRIAVLIGQGDENYQSRFISGLIAQAFSLNMDVCVFSMFRKYQDTSVREAAESNIFHLVNYSMFDGIVLLKDSIQTPNVARMIEENIKEKYTGPVLVVESESDFFDTLSSDNYSAMEDLVSHFIEKHNFTDIAYLTGKKWHKHSQQRLAAFKDTMEKHQLTIGKDRIIDGDFWYNSGERCADYLLSSDKKLPQAVICANDAMAIGLCDALEKRGVKIPADIAVAGFDSGKEGQTSPKTITSAILPAVECGTYAANYICDRLNGRKPKIEPVKPRTVIGESCGCHFQTMPDLTMRRASWKTENSEEGYTSVNTTMQESLMAQANLTDFINNIYSYAYQIKGASSFHLCLCSKWKYMEETTPLHVENDGYPRRMIYAIRYHSSRMDSRVGLDETFETKDILPELWEESDKPRAFIFTPVFFESECYGYAAVSYGDEGRSYDEVYRRWIMAIARGFEHIRQKCVCDILQKKLLEYQKSGRLGVMTDAFETLDEEQKQDYELVKKILDENLLTYHFQPIVNAKDGSIFAYEALMRSNTEKRISPLDIIKYAFMQGRLSDVEEATFINVLSVLEHLPDLFGDAKMFINSIPGVQVSKEAKELITTHLKKLSSQAVVELTESSELSEEDLNGLKDYYEGLNVPIAVDDYGTGYSNVSNLLRYKPNFVKIDRSLLSGIHEDTQKQHFVREIIEFCHDSNIKALAEGVETKSELQEVIHLGADLIQGYYTARPSEKVISVIDEKIVQMIKIYSQEKEDGALRQIYRAGKSNRVNLAMLEKDGCSDIIVGDEDAVYKDFSLIGTPANQTGMHIRFENGYEGRVSIENVLLTNVKGRPSIELGENCKVTLILNGENGLLHTGIKVPESSELTMEGEGSLLINLDGDFCYGIGNDENSRHGKLVFEQDGKIRIECNGKTVVGIGSGLGGVIRINRGHYQLMGRNDTAVGLGCINGDALLDIDRCLLESDYQVKNGVSIGSLKGEAITNIFKSLVKITGGGSKYVGIGTLGEKDMKLKVFDANVMINIGADDSTCAGSLYGKSIIMGNHAGMTFENVGKNVLIFGGLKDTGRMELWDVDTKVKSHSGLNVETYFKEDRIRLVNGKCKILVNNKEIERNLRFETMQ
ncbi:MAG: EAL domain-containing protein [Lachnospiraceae bacterium]|nr:EAL domain-containing protein [Lachnospiraceae bacterium]